jgi:hypothetical protein
MILYRLLYAKLVYSEGPMFLINKTLARISRAKIFLKLDIR